MSLLAGLLISPGQARAALRDDVMAKAIRCSSVGSGRTWLTCYYDAAAPMRAFLKLPPAEQPHGDVEGTLSPDEARARDMVLSQAFGCTNTPEDRQWLDCFYGAAQPMRSQLGLSPAPQAANVSSGASVESARILGANRKAAVYPMVSRLAAYRYQPNGMFIITLANGEVWQQIDGDTSRAGMTQSAEKYIANVRRGFFGSYNVQIKGVPGLFRAHRIS